MTHYHSDCLDCMRFAYGELSGQFEELVQHNAILQKQVRKLLDEKNLSAFDPKAKEKKADKERS